MKPGWFALGIVAVFCVVSGCLWFPSYESYATPLTLYEVHEWGVFIQNYSAGPESWENTVETGGPRPDPAEMPNWKMQAEKPVIYFHGSGRGDVTVDIDFVRDDALTIPTATETDTGLRWEVEVAGDVWNHNGDGDYGETIVIDGSDTYEYLFYEGSGTMAQPVVASVTDNGTTLAFSVHNTGDFTLHDIHFWLSDESGIIVASIESLAPGASVTVDVAKTDFTDMPVIRSEVRGELVTRGLTDEEALDLTSFWIDGTMDENDISPDITWFETDQQPQVALIYTMPQSEYDEYIPLAVDPEPETTVRVGIVLLTEIPYIQ